jgi:hypothetical protein
VDTKDKATGVRMYLFVYGFSNDTQQLRGMLMSEVEMMLWKLSRHNFSYCIA